jgi:adenylate cyclase
MLNQPDNLALGGMKKTVTIMFTDLVDFTKLSERLEPEQLSTILNDYFTSMTDIIMNYHGTVDKFIGDAIMVFWGAPLDDHNHAQNALETAIEMQYEVNKIRQRNVLENKPKLFLRIGISSGDVIVGNMGSRQRFDYTVIGDEVNLASRLEGVNKLYGTDILISERTLKYLSNHSQLVYIDTVCVAGKSERIKLYTWFSDINLIQDITEAIDHFNKQSWKQSELCWQQLVDRDECSKLANLYLDKIKDLQRKPLLSDKDFITILSKM